MKKQIKKKQIKKQVKNTKPKTTPKTTPNKGSYFSDIDLSKLEPYPGRRPIPQPKPEKTLTEVIKDLANTVKDELRRLEFQLVTIKEEMYGNSEGLNSIVRSVEFLSKTYKREAPEAVESTYSIDEI